MTKELWKDIKGYEGYYQISKSGRVRSVDRVVPDGRGYEKEINGGEITLINDGRNVLLSKNGKVKYHHIKSLLKENFDNRKNKITHKLTKNDIIEIKKIYLNNKLTIKEIANNFGVTASGIEYHINKLGLSRRKPKTKKLKENEVIQIKKLLKEGNKKQVEIAKMYGVVSSNISQIKRGVIWSDVKINDKIHKLEKGIKEKKIKEKQDNFLQKFIKRILNIK